MQRFKVIVLVLFPVFFLTFNTGCANTRTYYSRYREAPEGKVFFSPSPNFEDPSSFSKGPGPINERDKIRYLLGRIADSNNRFIRNGEVYNGKEARQWLLYKFSHGSGEIVTAQDFVARLSFSRQSGRPYLMESLEGEVYSLRSVLKNELSAFENRLTREAPTTSGAIPRPAQVSLSPTTVATTAVAHSTN